MKLRRLIPGIECLAIPDAGAVALGALIHIEDPLTDSQVADTDLGLEYREEFTPSGRPFKKGLAQPAIG
ncbi:hypothetical protein FE257_004344 [Aspergillus nanangensis]|uniref:Uncharacterized protein n=1 Tax=Aspergillus nanangensis TaxID=2582783 RepID=A0AAD4GME5_ASPNN|nr:hypothetical protein FE257_004344 [Aspergillus nanangensis]